MRKGRKSLLRSKRLAERRRQRFRTKTILFLVFFLFLIIGAAWTTHANFSQISSIEINGNKLISNEKIKEIIKEETDKPIAWFFSKNNFFLFPRGKIEDRLFERFKHLTAANVSFNGVRVLSITIKEREPKFLWCRSPEKTECYFMDEEGYIFSEGANFSDGVYFTYYGLVEGDPIDQRFLSFDSFKKINSFTESLRQLSVEPESLIARSETDFELNISTGGKILFSSKEDFWTTFTNLEAIITEQRRKDKDFLSKLDYIDLRFGSKAFYKLK